uniref:Uncharacterized protein n=1 Tax=Anguilla anguilla TaxID=7936 RepID=A0A0E9X9H4_ANGAN
MHKIPVEVLNSSSKWRGFCYVLGDNFFLGGGGIYPREYTNKQK